MPKMYKGAAWLLLEGSGVRWEKEGGQDKKVVAMGVPHLKQGKSPFFCRYCVHLLIFQYSSLNSG